MKGKIRWYPETEAMNAIKTIKLLPVGRCDDDLAYRLRAGIKRRLDIDCELGDFIPRPLDAFDDARLQYEATKVLARVEQEQENGSDAILAIIDNDIYIEPFNFAFGHTGLRNHVGLLSLTRLKPEFWGDEPDRERFYHRALAEALYQLGRILGLSSCETDSCAMCAANGIADVDKKDIDYCPECRAGLGLPG